MNPKRIKSPNFQRLQALDKFSFHQLNPVGCNICGSEERKILFTEGVFEIVRCRDCGLVYVSNQPSETELRAYYRRFYSVRRPSGEKRWRNIESFLQAYGYLKRFLPDRNRHVLEIGCGYGYFLELIGLNGYRKTTGIEPDEAICKACRKRNPQARIINADFVSHDFKNSRFDAIVMLASLEHFPDPLGVLKKNYDLLNAGGLILIRVPCLEGFFRLNRLLGRTMVPFGAPRHLYDFNRDTLTKITRAAGFQPLEVAIGARETGASCVWGLLTWILKKICFWGERLGWGSAGLFSGSLILAGKKP